MVWIESEYDSLGNRATQRDESFAGQFNLHYGWNGCGTAATP